MNQNPQTHWRQLFERGRREERPPESGDLPPYRQAPPTAHPFGAGSPAARPAPSPLGGYDDGFDPAGGAASAARTPQPSSSSQDLTDEAAMALALNPEEYRPWILQRGTRSLMMLHLRRFDARAGHWIGWQVSYPHLVAVEYVGDRLLSLDFGARHFVIEGSGLDELARHLQTASVHTMLEYTSDIWAKVPSGPAIQVIRCVAPNGPQSELG